MHIAMSDSKYVVCEAAARFGEESRKRNAEVMSPAITIEIFSWYYIQRHFLLAARDSFQ